MKTGYIFDDAQRVMAWSGRTPSFNGYAAF